MNILFICMDDFTSFAQRGTYTDIIRQFIGYGHNVYAVSPTKGTASGCIHEDGSMIIKPFLKESKNYIQKGLSVILLAKTLRRQIDKDTRGIRLDAIVYSTPPITVSGVVRHYKRRDGAVTYLLLKDIWPQVMEDVGLLTKHGVKGIVFGYFRSLEKKLYKISDRIGCMSEANAQYLKKMNSEIPVEKVHVSPNSLEPRDCIPYTKAQSDAVRNKYGIPTDKKVFLYGGNLGIMQGVPFLVECLEKCRDVDCCFVICGFGTHYRLLTEYVPRENPKNVILIPGLERDEFDTLTAVCDVGLAFLSWKCTTPNFPSKILPYMECSKPVFICADGNTDIGKAVSDNSFGWYCPSNDSETFRELILSILNIPDVSAFGDRARTYLENHYTAKISYDIISKEIEDVMAGREGGVR